MRGGGDAQYDAWAMHQDTGDDYETEYLDLGAHLQVYIVLRTRESFTRAKQILDGTGEDWARTFNFTVATETERSLKFLEEEYCNNPQKEGVSDTTDFFRFGVFPTGKPGNANKDDMLQQLKGGKTLKRHIEDGTDLDMLIKCQRLIQFAERAFGAKRGTDFAPRIIWLCSKESGTGKSFYVLNGGLEKDYGIKLDDCYFWNGSTGGSTGWVTEDAIGKHVWVMQEACGQHCTPDALKELWDRGPAQMQCKGGMVECLAHTWVITTNFDLDEWWGKLKIDNPDKWERHMVALRRRLQEWGCYPNFKAYLRNHRLEQRMTEQGGLRVRANGTLELRRITPERMLQAAQVLPGDRELLDLDELEGMSQHERDAWLAREGYNTQEREEIFEAQRVPFDS